MKATAVLALLCGVLANAAAGDWRQSSLGYVEADLVATPYLVINRGTATLELAAQAGEDTRVQWILGAAPIQAGPAWDTRFDPLTHRTITFIWSVPNHSVPPNRKSFFEITWRRSVGWQEFELFENGAGTGTKLRRDRDWHDVLSWHRDVVALPPTDPPGGGGD